MTDEDKRDALIKATAKRFYVPFGDLKARMALEPDGDLETMARLLKWQFVQIEARSGELAYLMQYEGDIFANAELYRTIRGDIVARAS